MGTGGTSENSGQPEADNVIRFPRDWFGSKDDLIPIGPAADRLAEIAAERENALGAADFWGERSGALHQPVDLPREEDAAAAEPADDRGAKVRALHVVPLEPARLTRTRVPRLAVPRAAIGLAVMMVAALGLLLSGVLRPSPHPDHPVSASASRSVTTPSAPSEAVTQTQLIADSQMAMRSAVAPYLVKTTPTHNVRHVARQVRRTKPAVRRTTQRHAHTETTSAGSTGTAAVTHAVTSPSVSAPVGGTPLESGNSSLSSSVASTRPSPASTSSSAGASTTSSGPTGLGQAVGPGCDPQCSG